jgi:hypothetical protein
MRLILANSFFLFWMTWAMMGLYIIYPGMVLSNPPGEMRDVVPARSDQNRRQLGMSGPARILVCEVKQ